MSDDLLISKLYLIKRLDGAGYDEAEGFVIRASNTSEAWNLVLDKWGDWMPDRNEVEFTYLGDGFGPSAVILTDFHAG